MIALQIFHLKARQHQGLDEFQAFVIAAKSDREARRLAGAKASEERCGSPERRKFWGDLEKSRCQRVGVYTGDEKSPHIILSDYTRG